MNTESEYLPEKTIQPDRQRNPYIAGKALGGRVGFFGRQEIIDWVERELYNQNQNSLLFYGQRRIGRTSILLQLERRLPRDRFCPVYFDLADQASRSLGEVLADLADALAEALALDFIDRAAFDDSGDYFQQEFLPQLYAALGDERRPVLLLDECDGLDDTAGKGLPGTARTLALFSYLSHLMRDEPRLAFVIVIGWQQSGLSDRLFKSSLSREVWVLAPDDARQLIRQANEDGSLQMDDAAVERIFALTAGHPYLTQLLCQRIWERAHASADLLVGEEDVQSAIPDALQVCFNPLNWIWDGLAPAEKIFSAAIAGMVGEGESITGDSVRAVLAEHAAWLDADEVELAPDALVKRHVLEPAGENAYRYAVELLRRWVDKHKPLRAVKRELDRIDPLADILFRAGRGYFDRRDWGGAIPRFREALEHNPRHFKTHLFLGEALLQSGDIDEALKVLQVACNLDWPAARPSFARAWLALAASREQAGSDEQGILKAYDVVLRLSPGNKIALEGRRRIWSQRGHAALEDKDLDAALIAFQQAGDEAQLAELESTHTQYQVKRMAAEAAALAGAHDWEGALLIYRDLAQQQPDEERWQEVIGEMETGQALVDLFQTGAAAVEAKQWGTAQRALADLLSQRPTYRHSGQYAAELLWQAVEGEFAFFSSVADAGIGALFSPSPQQEALDKAFPLPGLEVAALEISPSGLALVQDIRALARLDPLPQRIIWKADGVEMVLVPGGVFLMGSDEGKEVEGPVHEVYVPAFYLDRTPVTNAQYRLFIEAGGYKNPEFWNELGWEWREKEDWSQPRFMNEARWAAPDLPVVGVSWYEALAYARWAGKRLPTEAEWEKAGAWNPAAGLAYRYPWGDKWNSELCNTKEKKGIFAVFRDKGTTPVGQFSPDGDSPCGAADMSGNVWEWCSTRWTDYPYHPDDGREELDGRDVRVLRGGSWATDADRVLCAARVTSAPSDGDKFRGFRCCCALPLPSSEF